MFLAKKACAFLVGSSGLEPPTSRLSGVRSNRLSYEPISISEGNAYYRLATAVVHWRR